MAARDRNKPSADFVEEATAQKYDLSDDNIPMPPSLAGLNDAELKKLGRRATWKLDVIIMPAMTM